MMELTTPKKPGNLFYVSSEAEPNNKDAQHIVVQVGPIYFCDCRDFMVRKLPNIGTPHFELCKHGRFVRDVTEAAPAGAQIVKAVRDHKNSSRFAALARFGR